MGGCLSDVRDDAQGQVGARRVGEVACSTRDAAATEAAAALLATNPAMASHVAVECDKLKRRDLLSKSDPLAVLLVKHVLYGYREVGQTEFVSNCHSPRFVKKIKTQFRCGTEPAHNNDISNIHRGRHAVQVRPAASRRRRCYVRLGKASVESPIPNATPVIGDLTNH